MLTNSNTSESSTAILHNLKNEVYPLIQCILDCSISRGLLYLPFLPSGKMRSTVARLEARSTQRSWKLACTRLLIVRALHLRTTCACAIKQTWLSLYIGNHANEYACARRNMGVASHLFQALYLLSRGSCGGKKSTALINSEWFIA